MHEGGIWLGVVAGKKTIIFLECQLWNSNVDEWKKSLDVVVCI